MIIAGMLQGLLLTVVSQTTGCDFGRQVWLGFVFSLCVLRLVRILFMLTVDHVIIFMFVI